MVPPFCTLKTIFTRAIPSQCGPVVHFPIFVSGNEWSLLKVELRCHQLCCKLFASLLSFSAILSKDLTSFQNSRKLLFFLNIVSYFVFSKQIWILYDQLFLEFPYEGKSVWRCRHLFSIGGKLLTFIRKFLEGKNRILVVGYSTIHICVANAKKSPFSGKIIKLPSKMKGWRSIYCQYGRNTK